MVKVYKNECLNNKILKYVYKLNNLILSFKLHSKVLNAHMLTIYGLKWLWFNHFMS